MSCSCTGNCDLVNISNLVLSDTFHTWFDRTNEVINTMNNVNIYDVDVGVTDGGLTSISGCPSNNYNGVVTLKVNPGPGIGVGTTLTPNYYLNHTMIDVSGMTEHGFTGYDAGLATAFPANDDWFIFSDSNDSTLGSGNGTPKKIKAQQILPPTVYLPVGFQFNGNVSINGNLNINGTQSVIDSNDLLIEDKAIELAYRRFVSVDVTGSTSDSFPAPGMTFRYYDSGVGSTANPTTIGRISEVAFNGTNTNLKLHNFSVGGVSDIAPLGRISITGTIFDFTMVAGPTTSTSFFNDDQLDEAGFIVKGASGDKSFLWVYNEGPSQVRYDAFVSSSNLGVSGSSNAVIASKFRSYGYDNAADNNTFQFMGYLTGKPKIILGGSTGDSTANQFGYWSVQHDNKGGTSTQQPLVWGFKQYASGAETTKFSIYSGASGPTYPTVNVTGQSNNRVANFAEGLNVDFLDGAHGTTMATAWSIPVALTDGTLADEWISPKSIKAITRCFTQASHGLVVGDVVRINPDTGGLTYALATSREYAEVLGVVSTVQGNEVCVVSEGYVFGLTGTAGSNIHTILPLVTGNVYFLSPNPNNAGRLISDPDNGMYPIGLGEVRKAVMMAVNANTGYVVNYLGVVEGEDTDLVEIQGIVPVGQIMPFSGPVDKIPYGWMACDGSRLEKGLWPELYAMIEQRYYITGKISNSYSGSPGANIPIEMPYTDSFGIQQNDLLTIDVRDALGINYSRQTKVVSVSGNIVSVLPNVFGGLSVAGLPVKVRGRVGSGGTSVFFLPDFRVRSLIGSVESLGGTFSGINANLGDSGGKTGSVAIYQGTDASVSTGTVQPYGTVNWIIRARKGLSALILSGHNHDDRYHRLNDNMKISDRGAFRLFPEVNGPTAGFNVYLDSSVYGRTANILSCFAPLTAYTGFPNSSPRFYEARTKVNAFGDLVVWGNGLSSFGGHTFDGNRPIFSFFTHSSSFTIEGGTGGLSAPSINFYTVDSGNLGRIEGLADTPRDDASAVNKRYTDTAAKIIYSALPAGENAPSQTRPTNQFNVVMAANALYAGSPEKSIISVVADNTPTDLIGNITAKTQLHVRGDINAWGNGLTGSENSQILKSHTLETFSVNTLKNEVRVYGGWTYGDQTEQFPPKVSLWNRRPGSIGPSVNPIGIVEGLTSPTQHHQAANKWYVDKTVADNIYVAPIATVNEPNGRTGVAIFESGDFDVNPQGLVTLRRGTFATPRIATNSLTGVASFNSNSFNVTPAGNVSILDTIRNPLNPLVIRSSTHPNNAVRIYTSDDADLSGELKNKSVFQTFVNSAAIGRINPPDSAIETYVHGDFTVFGDNVGVTHAHNKYVFAVDPKVSTVTIYGGHTQGFLNGTQGPTASPLMVFQDERGGDRGRIIGLTAPSINSEAANKWYVDNSNVVYYISPDDESDDNPGANTYLAIGSGSTNLPTWHSTTNQYFFRKVSNEMGGFTQKSAGNHMNIEKGTYSVNVSAVIDCGVNTRYLCIIKGFTGATETSKSRPFYNVKADVEGMDFACFSGVLKIVDGGHFTVGLTAVGSPQNFQHTTINNIMLTKIGNA